MLRCFGDYNNRERVCRVSVTDAYQTRMFFLSYEVWPRKTCLLWPRTRTVRECSSRRTSWWWVHSRLVE